MDNHPSKVEADYLTMLVRDQPEVFKAVTNAFERVETTLQRILEDSREHMDVISAQGGIKALKRVRGAIETTVVNNATKTTKKRGYEG